MLNEITIPSMIAGRKVSEVVEGRGFQYKGVALHLRKISSLWVISLFNTGLLTRGSARTIEEAIGMIVHEVALEQESAVLRHLHKRIPRLLPVYRIRYNRHIFCF